MHVKTPLHGHYAHRFLLARLGPYRHLTHEAARRILFVKALDTVNFVGGVHRERYAVQVEMTRDATETFRMKRLAGRS